ncbi:VOC family protein [Brevundimonas goettingensis]|uniref:VOC family protein n=1 Tax=Brevundimonas goettingensis TaxID=2774190 RepID=A0A975GWF5_9CAUL|nr:VOC family protein [Brevundimonas goettingensis]QTC91778.1 VOC family protein [Brevundimonas goettingensis]
MTDTHHIAAIVPASDLDASTAFYRRLGLEVTSDHGHYRLLDDSRGWRLHLNRVTGWPATVEDNPLGLYLYVEDVDAVADRVRDLIIEPGTPHLKPWGTYEFAVSDPNGTLVRIGRAVR